MGNEVQLWEVGAEEQLLRVNQSPLDLEERLQEWIANDIAVLDPRLLVIGREVLTDFGGFIDLLCVDANGDLAVVELKRDKTPREVVAQALDYASWVVTLTDERITSIAAEHLKGGFEEAFNATFGVELPETLNGDHRILVVASQIDRSSERIIKYLSDSHGVNINAATFQYFRLPDGRELLARVFLIDLEDADQNTRTKGTSKRQPSLTFEDFAAIAQEKGVADLYEHALRAFDFLQKRPSRSTVSFYGTVDGGRHSVLAVLPGESSADDGLRFHLYDLRFASLAQISGEEVEALLPPNHEEWNGTPDLISDFGGSAGFITTTDEIDRLAAALRPGIAVT